MEPYIGEIHHTHDHFVDNETIELGYRINFSSKSLIFKSLFMLHNESVNIWTHIIGVTIFITLIFWTAISIQSRTGGIHTEHEITFDSLLDSKIHDGELILE